MNALAERSPIIEALVQTFRPNASAELGQAILAVTRDIPTSVLRSAATAMTRELKSCVNIAAEIASRSRHLLALQAEKKADTCDLERARQQIHDRRAKIAIAFVGRPPQSGLDRKWRREWGTIFASFEPSERAWLTDDIGDPSAMLRDCMAHIREMVPGWETMGLSDFGRRWPE